MPAASAPASFPSLVVPHWYASVGRLAGGGASTLSVHGLCGNGTLEAGLTVPPVFLLRGYPGSAKLVLGRHPSCGVSAGPSRCARIPCCLADTLPLL